MTTQTIITLDQLCDCYGIDPEIIRDFADFGLYPVVSVEGEFGIEIRHLARVERVISLYRSLGVNKEGIDIILELRSEIASLQSQVEELENKVASLQERLARDDPEFLRRHGLLIEIDY